MNKCIIKQPIGIGDIFFCQKIAKKVIEKGYEIIWPVNRENLNFNEYMSHELITYVDINEDFVLKQEYLNCNCSSISYINEDLIICTDGCSFPDLGVMRSKYKLVNLCYKDWNNYFSFKRNNKKENELFYDVLGLNDDIDYRFVNKNIGSKGYESTWNIPESDTIANIQLTKIQDFNIFDWSKVIECASEIYVMETSITYIIDKLLCKSKEYVMYGRNNISSPNFIDYTEIYKNKPWRFFDNNQMEWKNGYY